MQRRGKDVEQVERLPGHAVKRSSAHAAEPARHASGGVLAANSAAKSPNDGRPRCTATDAPDSAFHLNLGSSANL